MDKKLLGKRINTARKEKGWTGERLSEECSITATYLRQIESGAEPAGIRFDMRGTESFSRLSPRRFLDLSGSAGHGYSLGALSKGHTKANEHDNRDDPQRVRSCGGMKNLSQIETTFVIFRRRRIQKKQGGDDQRPRP